MRKTPVYVCLLLVFVVRALAHGQANSYSGPQLTSQATIQDCCATLKQTPGGSVSGTGTSISAPPFDSLTGYAADHIGTASASVNANVLGSSNSGISFTATATANATPPADPHVGSLHAAVGQSGTYYEFTLTQPSYVEMDASFTPSGGLGAPYGGYGGSASLRAGSPGGGVVQGNNQNNANVYFAISDTSGSGNDDEVTVHTGTLLLQPGTYDLIGGVSANADTGQSTTATLSVTLTLSPSDQIGTVTCVQGSATITSPGGQPVPVTVGMPLFMGEVISTGAGSQLCALLNDNTILHVGTSSRLTIDQYFYDPTNQTGMARYGFLSGVFNYVSGLIGQQPNHDIDIHVPAGAIGIRGTELIANVTPQNATVYLDSGEVTVTPASSGTLGDYLAQTVITFDANTATTSAFSQSDYDALKQQITGSAPDTQPPTIQCGAAPAGWQATNVTIACTASDSGSGLANAADASFTLSTSVGAGTETANASTGSHPVCDKANNCATAGPITGIMIDMKAPGISISAPAGSTTYLLNSSLAANYQCQDGGSGVQTCTGPVATGAKFDTTTVGSHTFTVNAKDNVGNASSGSSTYSVAYGICLLFDNTRSVQSGSTVPIRIALCDSNGNDVSTSAVVVQAVSLTQVSTSASAVLESPGSSNPDGNFRFDPTLGTTGGYIFNLQTTGLTTGTYALGFTAGSDPTTHTLTFQVR